jgi:hypothetical protein
MFCCGDAVLPFKQHASMILLLDGRTCCCLSLVLQTFASDPMFLQGTQ